MKTIIFTLIIVLGLSPILQGQTLPATSQGKQITVFLEPEIDVALLRPHQAVIREQPGTQKAAQAQLEIGQIYYRSRAYSGAIPEFEKVASLYSSSKESESALYHLARSYAQLYRDEEALATLAVLEKRFPQSVWNRESASIKSQSYFRLLRFKEAVKEAEAALSGSGSKDDRLDVLISAGRSYKILGQQDEALKTYEQVLLESPQAEVLADAHMEIGAIKKRQRKYREAEASFKRASDLYQSDGEKAAVQYEVASLFFEWGAFVRASMEYQTYLQSFPTGTMAANASFHLGRCYLAVKKYDEAIEQFLRHQSQYPDDPRGDRTLFFLAECYRLEGKDDLARQSWNRLIQQYPKSNFRAAAEKLLRG